MGYDFNCGGSVIDLGQPVITGDEIDYNTVGYYTQLYTVTDNAGNSTSVEITFQVIDPLSVSESNIDNIYFIYFNFKKFILSIIFKNVIQ